MAQKAADLRVVLEDIEQHCSWRLKALVEWHDGRVTEAMMVTLLQQVSDSITQPQHIRWYRVKTPLRGNDSQEIPTN